MFKKKKTEIKSLSPFDINITMNTVFKIYPPVLSGGKKFYPVKKSTTWWPEDFSVLSGSYLKLSDQIERKFPMDSTIPTLFEYFESKDEAEKFCKENTKTTTFIERIYL